MDHSDVIRETLELIAASNDGRLTPEAVVESARDKSSPIHQHFEWNNSAAAHKWRIEQARQLIRSVRVEITEQSNVSVVPCYVRDPRCSASEQGYVSVVHLKSDYESALEAANDEFRRADSALRRARMVADALGVAADVDDLISGVETVSAKVRKTELVA